MDVASNLASWLEGDLSPTARIWSAAAPALALVAYVFGGMVVFAARNRLRGDFHDREMEKRGSTLLLGAWLRNYFAWLMSPVFGLVLKSRLPPNAITTLSLLLAGGAGVALAAGRFALGGWLYVGAAVCDFLDGRLARETGKASESGALLDSVLDRYCEAAVLLGLAAYYSDSWVLYPVLFALVGSMLVPYVKARGEAMGVAFPNIGLMQRPERIVLLGATVALSPIVEAIVVPNDPAPLHRLAVVGVVVLAATTQITAVQRLFFGRKALSDVPPPSGAFARGSIFRNLTSSSVATLADFSLVAGLVAGGLGAPVATLLGCVLGGAIHFTLGRYWAFRGDLKTSEQASRYLIVSGSSALLNSGLVAVLLLLPSMPYQIAWVLVRGAVFLTWNHPLSRDYVFEHRGVKQPEAAEPDVSAAGSLSNALASALQTPLRGEAAFAYAVSTGDALGVVERRFAGLEVSSGGGRDLRVGRRDDESGAYPHPADPMLRTG